MSRGFKAETNGDDRVLFVPYSTTTDMAQALLLCRHRGLVAAKLNAMPPAMAWCVYFLTLARREDAN